MKKWILELMTILVFSAALVACGGDVAPAAVEAIGGSESQSDALSPTAVIAAVTGNGAAISTDYDDALPVEMQLAFGTMRLENTNLALTAEQAQAILPYWRVLQSMTQNGNAADAEINAVLKQIQDGMAGEQIAAIAAMALTEEKLQTMLEDGSINFGRGLRQDAEEGGTGDGLRPGRGQGGGLPGGGPRGGGPGGFGGDQADFATRQAELEASGENPLTAFLERAYSNMVIRLLETKTGEAPATGFGGFGAAFAVVSELSGLSEEEIGVAMSEGQTLGELLEANGVSAAEAKEVMLKALDDVQLADDQELDSWIDGVLTGSFTGRQDRNTE